MFTEPGPYRVVIDAYPNTTGPQRNFQLFGTLRVAGAYKPQALPPYSASDVVDGYRITLHGKPNLHAIQAAFLKATVTDPSGKPATFTPWFGALAHAIFFRAGLARLLPHARLRPRRSRLHECARRDAGHRQLVDARRAQRRRARPGPGNVAALPAVPGRTATSSPRRSPSPSNREPCELRQPCS